MLIFAFHACHAIRALFAFCFTLRAAAFDTPLPCFSILFSYAAADASRQMADFITLPMPDAASSFFFSVVASYYAADFHYFMPLLFLCCY